MSNEVRKEILKEATIMLLNKMISRKEFLNRIKLINTCNQVKV